MDEITRNKIFREWVNQYYDYGFRVAFRIVGNEEECRDLVQDAFLKVWINLESFNGSVKFSTWLFSIISNLCFDLLRRKKSIMKYADQPLTRNSDETPSSEEQTDEKLLRDVLNKLTDNLSPKQKMVFVMRDMEDMPIDEICDITSMTTDQVKSNLYYARKAIHKDLVNLKILEEKI